MKKTILFTAMLILSFNSFAHTVSAVSATLDNAEEKISELAKNRGMSYEIIGATIKERVYMIAKLINTDTE